MRRYRALSGQVRLVAWAAFISLLLALTGQAAPFDYIAMKYSSSFRSVPADGSIVVVGIDDKTTDALGAFPIKRRYYADMIDRLADAGARHIYINLNFSAPSDPEDDILFAEALKRHKGKVSFAAGLDQAAIMNHVDGGTTRRQPLPQFRNYAEIFDSFNTRSEMGTVTHLPFRTRGSGEQEADVASLSAKLADSYLTSSMLYRIDFVMRPDTVPVVSALDVVDGQDLKSVQGKDAIIVPTSWSLGEYMTYPGYDEQVAAIYMHIAGAETLKKGIPDDLGWFPMWAVMLFLIWRLSKIRSAWLIVGSAVLLVAAMFAATLLLNSKLIFVDVAPAFLMLFFATIFLVRARQRAYLEQRSFENHVSGLPNLAALQQLSDGQRGNLVAAKIHNFAEIYSVLNNEEERELVEQIARRLSYTTGNAALHQGDEGIFAWVCEGEKANISADELDGMFTLFRSPIRLKDRTVDLNLTFGVDADQGRSISNRLGSALSAADDAKKSGERWKFVNGTDRDDLEWRISLLGQLDAAIDKGQVWVAYQPKFDLTTNRISGAEALVRWRHPERGDIPPSDFIPLAEAQDRVEKLTYFVLNDAIHSMKSVSHIAPGFNVSVNISPRLLCNPRLFQQIMAMLQDHRVDAGRLTLEITETAMLSGNKAVEDGLQALRDAGVHISIDDYGTGYSTLEYFRAIPATEIKIDRSFIALIEHSHSDRLMVHSTIQLAHAMRRNVIAEGVESVEQMDLLKEMGCDEVQGYFTGKPQQFNMLIVNYLPQHRAFAS